MGTIHFLFHFFFFNFFFSFFIYVYIYKSRYTIKYKTVIDIDSIKIKYMNAIDENARIERLHIWYNWCMNDDRLKYHYAWKTFINLLLYFSYTHIHIRMSVLPFIYFLKKLFSLSLSLCCSGAWSKKNCDGAFAASLLN